MLRTEIIAEIGQNHNGDMAIAMDLIRAAKKAGADVAKFQVYEARALFPPKSENPWFDYNCRTELKKDDVFRLAETCERVGIEFMASVFDTERIGWLEDAGVKRYKIASRSVHDTGLIAAVAATGKPMIVSLGQWRAATFPEIPATGGVDFLYCIAKYPAPYSELRLASVDFTSYAGFSDHSLGVTAACASFALGARILEKHMTLDKAAYGPDHQGSMTPAELAAIHVFRSEWEQCR
jgi:N-acetylneuraminate synthase/N,N'-diacetyllegionaminate synthase